MGILSWLRGGPRASTPWPSARRADGPEPERPAASQPSKPTPRPVRKADERPDTIKRSVGALRSEGQALGVGRPGIPRQRSAHDAADNTNHLGGAPQ